MRDIARAHGLALANKPDSQEICFIPGGDYKKFIDAYLEEQDQQTPDTSGDLVATTGEVIGHHEGIHNFTVGQRKGLGVSSPVPLYVIQIDNEKNRVTVGHEPELARTSMRVGQLNWVSLPGLDGTMRVKIKIRHRHEPAWASISMSDENQVMAVFDEPARAITPGQAAVFYNGDEVVGGGWIA